MGFVPIDFFNKYIIYPFYKNISKFIFVENNKNKYKDSCEKEHKEESSEKICNSVIIYSDSESKSVEDYGEFVKIIGKTPDYTLTSILYAKPRENYTRYVPQIPFLGKYSSLYYKPDETTEDLLGCFVDW